MRDRLIVALDKPSLASAKELIRELDDTITYYKVGLELFLNSKGEVVDFLRAKNKKIFLDLKFHDIPNTVAQAARWATDLGVDMFNVHASGGEEMLLNTMETVKTIAAQNGTVPPKVVAVTVLTSFNENGFAQMGYRYTIKETVLSWADICQKAGLDGVVCSPQEVLDIKKNCSPSFLTVCPGVRPLGADTQDQKRIMTPGAAIKNRVDYLVIGRPITQSPNPQLSAQKILEEMEGQG